MPKGRKSAAASEAQAQYISRTRLAEAEAQAKRILAHAETDADPLRGAGNALLRNQVAGVRFWSGVR